MILQIIQHTPLWVWLLLAALAALGLSQTRSRDMSLTRVTLLPLVMTGLALYGVIGSFGQQQPLALLAWAVGAAASLLMSARVMAPRGAFWHAEKGQLHVPGSWLPLGLILAIFIAKYVVGVNLALQPTLANDTGFALGCSFAYGVFSGLFMARGLALRKLARGVVPVAV